MSTLLERIGGEAAVKAVIESFYDKVFTDPFLATFFANTDFAKTAPTPRSISNPIHEWESTVSAYVHAQCAQEIRHEMGPIDQHFDAVAGHLVKTLQEFKVPEDLIAETAAAVTNLRDYVLDRGAMVAA